MLVRNTLWLVLGQGVRAGIQAVYFVLMARALGASGYGAFAGAAAWVAVLAPFAGLGYGNLLIMHVARNKSEFNLRWGNGLLMTLISGLILLAATLSISPFILPASIPLLLIIMVASSDLIFMRIIDLCAQAFQAFEQLHRTAEVQVLMNITRLLAIVVLLLAASSASVVTWGACYLISTIVAASISLVAVNKILGKPKFSGNNFFRESLTGFYFSTSLSAQNVYNDIDKSMLSRISTLQATGIYGAAYRLIDISFVPVRSLLWASNARFFRHGGESLRSSVRYAGSLLRWAIFYGLGVSLLLYIAAPYIPLFLGAGFIESVSATRWLAILPTFRLMHYFAADSLSGANYQGLRSGIQVIIAIVNVFLNLWLIPAYSWLGAAWSSCITDGLLAVVLWSTIGILLHKHSTNNGKEHPQETIVIAE